MVNPPGKVSETKDLGNQPQGCKEKNGNLRKTE